MKVKNLKDVRKNMCWVIVLKYFYMKLFELIECFKGVLFVCKFDFEKVIFVFGNKKFIVNKENLMMVDEINGFVFFIIFIVFVIFCVGFVCVLNRYVVESVLI